MVIDTAETQVVETSPRRRRREKRQGKPKRHVLVILAGVIAVVLMLLGAVALLVNGGSGRPATVSQPAVVLTTSGATRVAGGVPVGYPQTSSGAVAAAANYLQALGSVRMFNPGERSAIVSTISGSQAFADQATSVSTRAAAALGVDENGRSTEGDVVLLYLPQQWDLVAFDGGHATVDIWSQSIVGVAGPLSTNPPTAAWAVDRVVLVWAGDWKLGTYLEQPAIVPTGGGIQRPSPSQVIADAMRRFHPFSLGS